MPMIYVDPTLYAHRFFGHANPGRQQPRLSSMKSKHSPKRSGFSFTGFVVSLAALSAIGATLWYFLPSFDFSTAEVMPLMHTVQRGDFLHEITESGNVESASNVEIRCEVHSQGQGRTTILEIVPEGTYVKPGDFLVQFDDSSLETDRTKQEIVCNTSKAAEIEAMTVWLNAEIALEEYVYGKFEQEEQRIRGDIAEAMEASRKAKDYYEYSKKLAKRGYITKISLEGDAFAMEKADNKLAEAKTELKVLLKYTKRKMVNELKSAIETARARLDSEEASYKLDLERLELIKSQIEKCTIRAQEPGQVVYANKTDRRGDREVIIEAGVEVRERQVIIRLPDPKKMQVAAKINEAQVTNVKEGMPVTIRLDAHPDREFEGVVEKVNEYPAAASWWAGSVKEYETVIKILGSPPGLKPGLTAAVRIQVEYLSDVVQVPVQAIFEHGGKHYCVVHKNNAWKAREVGIGSTNDKVVVIEKGLQPGAEIVLGAFAYRDKVDLPDIPDEMKKNSGKGKPRKTAAKEGGSPEKKQTQKSPKPGGKGDDMFAKYDKNKDGQVGKDELPAQMLPLLQRVDADKNGSIDRGEWSNFQKKKRSGGGGGEKPRAGS